MAESGLKRITLDDVRKALALSAFDHLAAQKLMAPRPPRPLRRGDLPGSARLAAVLVLLYPVDGILTFPLMRRPEYEGVHSGQISLPGGSQEIGETFEQTALRETREEFGVTESIEIFGALTPVYVPPSDFEIHPMVGCLPQRPAYTLDPHEVAELVEAPLDLLLDDSVKGHEERLLDGGIKRIIPFYRVGVYQVWGATAAMLSELEGRLRAVLSPQ